MASSSSHSADATMALQDKEDQSARMWSGDMEADFGDEPEGSKPLAQLLILKDNWKTVTDEDVTQLVEEIEQGDKDAATRMDAILEGETTTGARADVRPGAKRNCICDTCGHELTASDTLLPDQDPGHNWSGWIGMSCYECCQGQIPSSQDRHREEFYEGIHYELQRGS